MYVVKVRFNRTEEGMRIGSRHYDESVEWVGSLSMHTQRYWSVCQPTYDECQMLHLRLWRMIISTCEYWS